MRRRTALLRWSLDEHWRLSDALGGHLPKFADAIRACELLGKEGCLQEARESLGQASVARHVPPPSAAATIPRHHACRSMPHARVARSELPLEAV